ncbi:ABC transporter permease [Rhizorhapis sp. SPR117]|uniref:ABC transporter permease n=1 Tax=Rhizorhapis sp. SPR117 TaxID=2912611 RepID=UPI001F028BB5|nr:ABC transporter permease [Rhizorhapis sp. SPR117]
MEAYRNSLGVALSVWKALLLREALARLFASRAAWFWLIAEPVLHMTILGLLYAVVRQRTVGGIDALIWLVLGLQGFFLFRRTGTQMAGAIDSNRALFSYRQVKPTDTVLMRGVLEGVLMVMVILVIVSGLILLGHDVMPADPIAVLGAFFGLWLLGVALGLNVSVLSELAPEFRQIVNMVMMPLYFISGVLFPIGSVPEPYRDWLLINPIVHGLDGAREGFAPYYHSAPGVSLSYLYACALVGIFVGLILHRRYAVYMVTK